MANGGNIDDYVYYVKKVDHKAEILKQSVEHQILSQFTAFVCVEKQIVDGKLQEVNETGKVKVVVPNLPPPVINEDLAGLISCSMQHATYSSAPSAAYTKSIGSAPPRPGALRNDISKRLNECVMPFRREQNIDRVQDKGENLDMLM